MTARSRDKFSGAEDEIVEINVIDSSWAGHHRLMPDVKMHLLFVGGLSEAVDKILHLIDQSSKIKVLRFFGHGQPGCQAVGGNKTPARDQQIACPKGKGFIGGHTLRRLYGRFEEHSFLFGWPRVELRGCSVGLGAEGEELLFCVANLLNVKAMADTSTQTKSSHFNSWHNEIIPGQQKPNYQSPGA